MSKEPDTVAEMQTWQRMRDRIQQQLVRQTGEDLTLWNKRIDEAEPEDEPGLRGWLEGRGVTGYPQTLLVWETFGYPDFLLASADELVDSQYDDRPELRPVLDAVVAAADALPGVQVQARKSHISLLTRRRTFAIVQASSKKRVDVGLRLGEVEPAGRLLDAASLGNDTITRRLALESITDLDDEAVGWLRRAYEESV